MEAWTASDRHSVTEELGLEVGPYGRIRFLLQGNVWMDNAFGGTGFDPDALLGIGVDL